MYVKSYLRSPLLKGKNNLGFFSKQSVWLSLSTKSIIGCFISFM